MTSRPNQHARTDSNHDLDGHDHEIEDHDRGLGFDLSTLSRRRSLRALGLAGLAGVAAACTTGSGGSAASSTTAANGSTTGGSCSEIPEETAGPYPGDGSNGPNVLDQSGVVRSDIRSSFGQYSGTATGVPLTVNLTVVDTANGCAGYNGAAVYLWHCDSNGDYSLYSRAVTNQNYLRGVQAAGSDGTLSFTTIFPGCYSGRWPHIHFEVYESVSASAAGTGRLRTSQLALPEDICSEVYATSGYTSSATNLARTSLESDNVFSDGWSLQLAAVTGSIKDGYVAELTVPV